MCPSCDLTVIKHLVSVLNMRATPSRNKAARIKHPFEIWGAACKAMDDAETSDELTPLHRSCAYRDALALGLLALRPIRLKNLAQLTLSEQLRFDGSAMAVQLLWLRDQGQTASSFCAAHGR